MTIKKIVFFTIIIASFFVINGLIHSIYTLLQKNSLVTQAKQELVREKKKNKQLKNQLHVAKRPQFVEEEARNKLFLAKPGEGVIVIASDALMASTSGAKNQDLRPNWQKWWTLFF
ncbi:MAG TPA: septum formation initiator family protein [Methylomirabilota bacterium]|nr:septum formation initiator family protein [Methylomirabilota bacterium]